MRKHLITIVAVAALTLVRLALGQSVPPLVNYQGRLTDQTGAPLAAGAYTIQFKLWDDPLLTNATDLIWGQQQNVTVQSNGVFNAILGAPGGSPIPNATPAVNNLAYAFTGNNCFLGVTVVSQSGAPIASPNEILPRQQLLSVPFAFTAASAGTATLASTVAPGSITTASLAEGSVTLDKLAPRPVGANVGIGGIAMSASSGTGGAVNNLVVTLVTTGRPVFAVLTSDGTSNMEPTPGNGSDDGPPATGGLVSDSGTDVSDYVGTTGWLTSRATMSLIRNGTSISVCSMYASGSQNGTGAGVIAGIPSGAFSFFDFPPAGTNTYKIQTSTLFTTDSTIYNSVLVVFEL
jgi:hypothetical protein